MINNLHLLNIPNMMSGDDFEGVKTFYKDHLVRKFSHQI